jgi:hypothetical protein
LTVNGKGLVTATSNVAITPLVSFGSIQSGTNSAATMTLAAGSSIVLGGGTNSANEINGVPLCTGFSPAEGQAVEWTALLSPDPCYTAATPSGGGITKLTSDVTAGPGSGSQAATVKGLDSVPFCTGFSPAEGQAVEWTALSTPNPCYTAATPSGGSLSFHTVPTPTAIVTDYDATHIQTPNAGTTIDSAGDLAAAGNVAAGGAVSSGVGTGARSAIHITDTGAVHDQVWNGPGAGYAGTIEYPAAGPTSGQVLTCVTATGSDCPLSWATPAAAPTTNQKIRTIGAVLTPSALTSCVYVAFAGTINAFHAVAGDGATVDTVLVKVETQPTFATFISTGVSGASDISNGGEQLTSVLGKVDTTLTSWTTTLAAGTTVCFVGSTFSAGTSVNANVNIAAN